jgi:hypothetical protein
VTFFSHVYLSDVLRSNPISNLCVTETVVEMGNVLALRIWYAGKVNATIPYCTPAAQWESPMLCQIPHALQLYSCGLRTAQTVTIPAVEMHVILHPTCMSPHHPALVAQLFSSGRDKSSGWMSEVRADALLHGSCR